MLSCKARHSSQAPAVNEKRQSAACGLPLKKKVVLLFGTAFLDDFGLVLLVNGAAQFLLDVQDPVGQHIRGNLPHTVFLVHGKENAVPPLVGHIHIVLNVGAVDTVKVELTISVAGFYDLRKMDTQFRKIAIKRNDIRRTIIG